jgi:hypothetical protein
VRLWRKKEAPAPKPKPVAKKKAAPKKEKPSYPPRKHNIAKVGEGDMLKLREEDKERYAYIRNLSWAEMEARLEQDPHLIPDVQLVRLVLETAKLDLAKERDVPIPKNQTNNILAIALSAESLPPERRHEIYEALKADQTQITQALERLNGGSA